MAIADPTRRDILELLSQYGQMTSTDIANNFKISAPAISQHLKVLREAKVVDVEKKAQKRIYQINVQTMMSVENWVQKTTRKWNIRFDKLEEVLKKEEKRR